VRIKSDNSYGTVPGIFFSRTQKILGYYIIATSIIIDGVMTILSQVLSYLATWPGDSQQNEK
jgi:hypothetical protein